jgi:hypothetical protein
MEQEFMKILFPESGVLPQSGVVIISEVLNISEVGNPVNVILNHNNMNLVYLVKQFIGWSQRVSPHVKPQQILNSQYLSNE